MVMIVITLVLKEWIKVITIVTLKTMKEEVGLGMHKMHLVKSVLFQKDFYICNS